MKQNKEIFEKYADKLLSAMKREALMNKEVAEIFGVPASYMTDMRKHPEKVVVPFMEKIRTWAISDKPLRGYKPPEGPDVVSAEINQQEADEARNTAEMKFRSKLAVKGLLKAHGKDVAEAVAESVNTEEGDIQMSVTPVDSYGEPTSTDKVDVAARTRKIYEAVQPENEIVITAHKNGKVDVSRLDPRTGMLVSAYEMEIEPDGALKLTYRFKS